MKILSNSLTGCDNIAHVGVFKFCAAEWERQILIVSSSATTEKSEVARKLALIDERADGLARDVLDVGTPILRLSILCSRTSIPTTSKPVRRKLSGKRKADISPADDSNPSPSSFDFFLKFGGDTNNDWLHKKRSSIADKYLYFYCFCTVTVIGSSGPLEEWRADRNAAKCLMGH